MQKGFATTIIIIIVAVAATAGTVWLLSQQSKERAQAPEETSEPTVKEEIKDLEMVMQEEGQVKDDSMRPVEEESEIAKMVRERDERPYSYIGTLEDVTGGNATGVAGADFFDNTYHMVATFENLPEPEGTDFYEGWVVRKSPFQFISSGVLVKLEGEYVNVYQSDQDLTDHDFYVLTIEPDDGNPLPAAHVLEGTMHRN